MKKLLLLVAFVFLGQFAFAQCPSLGPPFVFSPLNANNAWCGSNNFQKGINIGSTIPFPTTGVGVSTIAIATNGASSGDCNVGGGLSLSFCAWNGSAWIPFGGSGGGSGTVTSVSTGTGLAGGPITITGTLSIASTYRLPQACSPNDIPQWNGSIFTCLTISSIASLPEVDGSVAYGAGGVWTASAAPAISAANMTSFPNPLGVSVTGSAATITGSLSLANTPLTTSYDLLTVIAGNLARIGLGANGTTLTSNGSVFSWQTPSGTGTVTHTTGANGQNFPMLGNAGADIVSADLATNKYFDFPTVGSAPANPGAGNFRKYFNSATGKEACITSAGADCSPSGVPLGTSAQIPIMNAGATAYVAGTVSQDGTLSNAGVLTVTRTGNVAFAASATTDTTNASNIASGTLANARLAAVVNAVTGFQIAAAAPSGHYPRGNGTNYVDSTIQAGDVPTLNQNTSGTAANLSGTPALPNGTTGTTQSLGDSTTKLATDQFVLQNALVNPMITTGDFTYGGVAGAGTRLAGPTTPAITWALTETPSGGVAQAPVWSKGGLPGRNVTGASDTILGSDNAKTVTYCNPAPPSATACTTATAVAVTLPQAGSGCGTSSDFCQNYVASIVAGAGLVTVTPTTSKINGQTVKTMRNETCRFHTIDNTDWLADCSRNNNVNGISPDTGAANAYVVACPNVPPVVNGATCYFSPANGNTTASTINVSGIGVGPLTRLGGSALVNGDLAASPASYEIRYDGTRWTVPSPSGNTSGIVSGTQNTFGVYSDATHVSSGVNPLASVFFSNADRGQAMHDCQLANTNGVLGDWCDARGEVATAIPVHTNMFPRLSDFGGTTGNQGGGVYMPSGGITIDAGQYVYGNNLTIVGAGVGAGTAGKGPSSFLPSGSFAVGSGGAFNEFMFNFGLPSFGLSTNGFPGPYSTKVNGGFQVNCNNTADLAGIGIFSGQDGTSQSDFGVSNCVIANLIGGSHATSNGISLEHGYMTRGSNTSCIAGTTVSGGVLWNVPSTGWSMDASGLVIMDAPTGGAGGNASGANLKPGVEIIVGHYADNNGAGTSHGTDVTVGSSHSTPINGVYRVGSVADVATVTNVAWTQDTIVTGVVGTAVITAANDFGPDINAQTNNAPCTQAHLAAGPTNPFTDTNTCIWNSLVYFNGLTGNGAFLNGKTGIVLAASGSSFTAAVASAQTSQSGASAGTAASANAIDSWTQNLTHTGGNPSAVKFTKVGQIAWLETAIGGGAVDQCTSACVGTITPFSGGLEIDTPSGGREVGFITSVASGCRAAASEFPLHQWSLDGKAPPWLHDNHGEESYGAGTAVGENAATQGVMIQRDTMVTNIGKINNNGGTVADSFEPAGIKLSNNFGAVLNATLEGNQCLAGTNNPTYCIMDQFNLNNVASSTDPVSNYWTDGSGVVGGVFTNASPGTMTNGIDIYGGVLSGIYSGVTAQKIDSTGVNLMASALSSQGATANAAYTTGKAACQYSDGSVGSCASVAASAGFIGVLMAKAGGTLPQWAYGGLVTALNSGAAQSWAAGDFVCTDPSNIAFFISNGSTACATRQLGIAVSTASSTLHTVRWIASGGGGGGGSGTVNSGTAAQVSYYASSTNAVSGNPNLTITNGALTVGAAAAGASVQLFGNTSGSATIGVTATGGTLQLPSGTTATSPVLTTPVIGAATGTSLAASGGLSGQTVNLCADTSGSGTAQVCTTTPATFTVITDSCFTYTTTTTNSGAGLTVNANSLGAKSVAIPGGSGWTTTLGINIIPANKPILLCYDGTNMNVQATGTAATGLGSQAINTVAVGPVDTPGGGSATATFVAAPSPLYFMDPRQWIYFNEEFVNPSGTGSLGWSCGGTGQTVSEQAGGATTYGNNRIALPATNTNEGFCSMSGSGALFAFAYNAVTTGDIIMRAQLSSIVTEQWFEGMVNINANHGEATADYFGFAFDTSAGDTNFMCVHRVGSGTALRTSTGVAADTSIHRFRMRFTSAGHFSCSVDDGTETAMAPGTFTTSTLSPQIYIKTLANAATNITTDYFFHAIKAAR